MATLVPGPSTIQAAGNKPKIIEEYIGRVNTRTASTSIARMQSPAGWEEPGQKPEFDEFTVVLKGMLRVKTANSDSGCSRRSGRYRRSWRMGSIQLT